MFKSLFFSLGVLLGLVEPQSAPDIAARIYRSSEEIFVSATLPGAFPEAALELAAEGTVVAFEIEASIEGSTRTAVARQSLRYDFAKAAWIVGMEGGSMKIMVDRGAALVLAESVWGLRVGNLIDLGKGGAIIIKARPGILDEGGGWHNAGILWGYLEPTRRFSFATSLEIPR